MNDGLRNRCSRDQGQRLVVWGIGPRRLYVLAAQGAQVLVAVAERGHVALRRVLGGPALRINSLPGHLPH